MKKKLTMLLALLMAAACLPANAFAAKGPPALTCQAYIVVDAQTGQVILEKNADEQRHPASITKIMTLGLALEKANGNLDHTLTVSEEDVYSLIGTDSSYIALRPGEEVKFEDMLYATQMMSANDGANVLAAYIGGSMEGGVKAMNQKVEELGLNSTHFTNPHGLMDPNHYTTAREMMTIARWALEQPEFRNVFCRTESWQMGPTNKQPMAREFGCSDWMRVGDQKKRDYALGSKSGYHDEAGQTFVTLCRQGDVELLAVLLGSATKGDRFGDACLLMDYCFENFQKVELPAEERAFPMPVKGGGEILGNAKAPSRAVEVLLHKENLKSGYTMEYDLPESYTIGTVFTGVQRVKLVGNGWQTDAVAEFPMTCTGLLPVFEEAEGKVLPAAREERSWTGYLLAGAAAVMVLLVLGRLRKKKKVLVLPQEEEWQVISRRQAGGPTVSFGRSKAKNTAARSQNLTKPKR